MLTDSEFQILGAENRKARDPKVRGDRATGNFTVFEVFRTKLNLQL